MAVALDCIRAVYGVDLFCPSGEPAVTWVGLGCA